MSTPPDLGPLPEPLKPMEWQQFMWTAAQVEAERQRCYMLGVAAASQWRPIETAPKDGTAFLAFKRGETFAYPFVGVILDTDHPDCEYDGGVHSSWDHSYVDGATHWMPLPAAPSEPTKEGG